MNCCLHLIVINQIRCTSKNLTDLCFKKQNIKIKNAFTKVVYNVLAVKTYWLSIKVSLSINGARSVKLWKGAIKLKNLLKQILVLFKI